MKKLLIVESPAKIKTISKFLGKDFVIMSTLGHIKDLPPKKLGITMNGSIDLEYVVIEKKDKIIRDIVRQAKQSDAIYLAPDPDREGEIIAWHVEQEVNKVLSDDAIHRITFNEITRPAILAAIDAPFHVDTKKVAAQQARRVLDRWVGYEVSPILWRKITKGLSAGRVQSVALRIVCEREREIEQFVPEEYWSIEGTFAQGSDPFTAQLTHIKKKKAAVKNEEAAKTIVDACKQANWTITEINDKKRAKRPVAPFITSTLQQAAVNKLGFSVKKTMMIAQNLYEGIALQDPKSPQALITYMRTDSTRLSDTAIQQARSYIPGVYGKEYLPAKANLYSKKGAAQDAHEAIRPIDVTITPQDIKAYVSTEQFRVYELIWKRFIACQMTSAQYAQRQVVLQGGDYTFKVTGSTLIFDGFLRAYNNEDEDKKTKDEEKNKLPQGLEAHKPTDLKKLDPKQHFTQPPARYSEATLVKELEKQGIGRPSTYASILNTIQARNYVQVEKKRFMPTQLGYQVTDMLVENLPKIMNPQFTAHMEEDLDKIAQGDIERDTLLREFYDSFSQDLEKFKDSKTKKTVTLTEITCPQCNEKPLAIRTSKNGEFLGCSGFPDCTFTSNFTKDEDGTIHLATQEQPALLEETCEKCSSPLRKMKGRFGEFIACSAYPKCKYIKQNKANFPCPSCSGTIVQRAWKGGKFWGCANYPKCKFAIFSDIEQTPCPECDAVYLLKKVLKKGTTLTCPTKECTYKKTL